MYEVRNCLRMILLYRLDKYMLLKRVNLRAGQFHQFDVATPYFTYIRQINPLTDTVKQKHYLLG